MTTRAADLDGGRLGQGGDGGRVVGRHRLGPGPGRRRPGTWRPCRAGRGRAAGPPRRTRSTSRPGRAVDGDQRAAAARRPRSVRRPQVVGEAGVAGLDGAEAGDQAALARPRRPGRPRRRPWPCGGRPGCRSGRRGAGRRAAGDGQGVALDVGPGAESLDHVGHRGQAVHLLDPELTDVGEDGGARRPRRRPRPGRVSRRARGSRWAGTSVPRSGPGRARRLARAGPAGLDGHVAPPCAAGREMKPRRAGPS